MTLGEKIKSLRLSSGITQSALCGDVITRNMLSRIENGAALPSLPTLQYLSERLGVSAGYFLDEGDDPLPYRKLARLEAIKALYAKAEYAPCIALCDGLITDDEIRAIKASCLLAMAKEMYADERFQSAQALFREAQTLAADCLYDLSAIENEASVHLEAIHRAKNGHSPALLTLKSPSENARAEYYLYVYMLHVTQNTRYEIASGIYDTLKLSNTLYKKHISARLSMAAHNTDRAVTLLGELVDSFDTTPCDPLFRLNVLKDMENAAHLAGNYEQAYKCLVKKNTLMSGFEK